MNLFGIICLIAVVSLLIVLGVPRLIFAEIALLAVQASVFAKRHKRLIMQIGGYAVVTLLLLFGVCFLAVSPPKLSAAVYGEYAGTPVALTNLPPYVVGGGTSNINSQIFFFRQGRGFASFPSFFGTNAATGGDATFSYALGYRDPLNGTNYVFATTNLATHVVSATGTTVARGFKNFSPPDWGNAEVFKLLTISYSGSPTNKIFFGTGTGSNVVVNVGN